MFRIKSKINTLAIPSGAQRIRPTRPYSYVFILNRLNCITHSVRLFLRTHDRSPLKTIRITRWYETLDRLKVQTNRYNETKGKNLISAIKKYVPVDGRDQVLCIDVPLSSHT